MKYEDIRKVNAATDRRRYIILCVMTGAFALTTCVQGYLHFTGQMDKIPNPSFLKDFDFIWKK